jgi:hypothetical protein
MPSMLAMLIILFDAALLATDAASNYNRYLTLLHHQLTNNKKRTKDQ